MQGTAIVPDQKIAGSPDMLVDMRRSFRSLAQLLDGLVALRPRHADDAVGHEAVDQQAAASGLRMHNDGGMDVAGRISPLGRRLAVGVFLVVVQEQNLHPLGTFAQAGRQAVISGVSAGKQSVAAL